MKIFNFNPTIPINNKLTIPIQATIGDTINAKILKIVDNSIILQLDNNKQLEVTTKNMASIPYNIGDDIEFIVVDRNEDGVTLKLNSFPLNSKDSKTLNISPTISEDNSNFKLLGDIIDSEREVLIELFHKNNIPITEDALEYIESTKKYYGKVSNYLSSLDFKVESNMFDKDIKALLKYLLSETNIKKQYNNKSSLEKTNYEIDNHINNDNNPNVSLDNNINHLLKSDLENISLEKLVFMFKNNIEFTLNNTKIFNNLIEGNKTIPEQMNSLLETLKVLDANSNHYKKLLKIIKKFDLSILKNDSQELNKVYKELLKYLDVLEKNTKDTENKPLLSAEIRDFKKSLDFINKLNQNIFFLQIPLNINNKTHNLELYVSDHRNKKNNKSKTNTKVFIGLNTNNLDLVQVMIEINESTIKLNFKLRADYISNILKENQENLSNKLKKLGFETIYFKYNIVEDKINIKDLVLNDVNHRLNKLDLRV